MSRSQLAKCFGVIALSWPVKTLGVCLAVVAVLAAGPNLAGQDKSGGDGTVGDASLLQRFRKEFVPILPGQGMFPRTFVMGGNRPEEQPRHEVTFDYSFEIGKYEVPQNLWQAVMGTNPARWKGARNAVEMVSYDDALEFCRKVTIQMRAAGLIEATQVVRLPSEAEWEYCARAGTVSQYGFGDDESQLGRYAWYRANAAGNDPPIGVKEPNAWGLYDMHGYVWEWCLDVAHQDYHGAPTDGSPWMEGGDPSRRVIRGGSWKDPAESLRSAARAGAFSHQRADTGETILYRFTGGVERSLRDDAIGLRCVIASEKLK